MGHQQQTGFFLSTPIPHRILNSIITPLAECSTIEEAREAAEDACRDTFVEAGYEMDETAYATLYQLTAGGYLAHSECFPISGPEAR